MTLDSKAFALVGGIALLISSAGCHGSNDKGDEPKVATTEYGEATGGGTTPPSSGATSGPDGTSAGTTPTGPATSGTPYGDGTSGNPPAATISQPKPIELTPKA